MSTVRLQLHLAKAWANKQPSAMAKGKRLYGLVWKINRILINRSTMKSSGGNDDIDEIEVPSSDEEDEEDNLVKQAQNDDEDEDEDVQVINDDEDQDQDEDEDQDQDEDQDGNPGDEDEDEDVEKPVEKKITKRRGRKAKNSV